MIPRHLCFSKLLVTATLLLGPVVGQNLITCTGGALPPGNGENLEVTGECTVGAGLYKFGNVNVYMGGHLTFSDTVTDFWARSILIEKEGTLVAGSAASPIGTNGGKLTFHIYGDDQGLNGKGITCKSDQYCGMDQSHWTQQPTGKMDLPGGVRDYFYAYGNMPYDGGDPLGYFGYKVFAVSYAGTLQMFGKKGATYTPALESDSGTSWRRLNGSLKTGDTTLTLDRPVDWEVGDQIVVTTTDYLPGHSEQFTIDSINTTPTATTITIREAVRFPHNGQVFDLNSVPADIGPDPLPGQTSRSVDTRAAVALLSRSIRIVSAGSNLGEDFPAESTGNYFGAHTIFRQGFETVQLHGVEFYQMGQGAKMGHYPVHFHVARRVPSDTVVADCSIHDSMTRWITIHGTQGVLLQRNVGYKSIGHGFYLEDGTEIDNRFYSNVGILARGAVDNVQNPRKVPGILAKPYPDFTQPQEQVPYHSDIDHPSIFWITNGYNEFAYNLAAGATTCGVCYWLVPTHNSGMSMMQAWESYSSMQSNASRNAMTPLLRFEGNSCTTAMNSFTTVGNTSPCSGVVNADPAANSPQLKPLPNPYPIDDEASFYPQVDSGGGRFATRCPDGQDCSQVPKCATGATENCMVTVLDRYTTSFNWAETNFSAVWLRPLWYLLINSAITDVQNGGLTIVTGGGYTKSDVIDGHWALAAKSAFIGNTQDPAFSPYAGNAGPINPGSPLTCATQTQSPALVGNFCLLADEGISLPKSNFGINQRLFNIYDGPAYQESNAYLNVSRTRLDDCSPQANGGACGGSKYMYATMLAVPKDTKGNCYLPNAAIGWKQPNGFYYPPAFHSRNLHFQDVEIRHFVIEPLFSSTGHYQTDPSAVKGRYCTWNETMFTGFTDIDRQTELNDDDGSLTGLVNTVSVNEDPFFSAPVETAECASDVPENVPPGTAKTSPYDYVTTVIYPGCGLNCERWNVDCTSPSCYGVPLYRQYKNPEETSHASIRMAGQSTAQRSTLTVNHGKYYIDTTVSQTDQQTSASLINVFDPGQSYYVFDLFAKPATAQAFSLYVGPGFNPATDVFAVRANTDSLPIQFQPAQWPTSWPQPQYDAATGLLTVNMNMGFPEFQTAYNAASKAKCQPQSFCTWNNTSNSCGTALASGDKLYADAQNICARWPVKDVDCPAGGCWGFGFKLPPGFSAGPKPSLPPAQEPFPNTPLWNSPFVTASQAVAGKQCYYTSPPSRLITPR